MGTFAVSYRAPERPSLPIVGFREDTSDVVLYDFGVPQRLGREAVAGLRRIHADVARDLEHVLSGVFESDIRGSVVALEQTRYQSFIDDLPDPRLPCRSSPPTNSPATSRSSCPVRTGLRLVDQILGTPATGDRALTVVDARLIEDSRSPRSSAPMSSAFEPYHPLRLAFNRSELNNQFVKLVPGDDVVVVIELLFTVGDDDLSVTVCYPQKAIVPILASLSDIENAADQRGARPVVTDPAQHPPGARHGRRPAAADLSARRWR